MSRPPLLGELETAVMEFFWSEPDGDVKTLHRVVGAPRGVTANTIQSTVKRLFSKALLRRKKVSHAYIYRARCSRSEFQRQVLEEVVGLISSDADEAVLSAFVDMTERAGRDRLERLEALVASRLSRKEDPH